MRVVLGGVLFVVLLLSGYVYGMGMWRHPPTATPTVLMSVAPDGGGPDGGTADGGTAPLRRLRTGQFVTKDGFRSLTTTYYDTTLKTQCQPALDAQQVLRCFPSGPYKAAAYRGVDSKTGECLEEVVVGSASATTASLVGIIRSGASLHKVGARLSGGAEFYEKRQPLTPKEPKCVLQKAQDGTALYALGEDLTPTLEVLEFGWVDTPEAPRD